MSSVGEDGLGENPRRELEARRDDPRLARDQGAAVADYWDAMEEAEHTRMLAVQGLHELTGVLDRYEREHGVSHDDEDLTPAHRGEMQALWEVSELSAAAIASDYAALNANALLSMNSALDAMVEHYAPAMREIALNVFADQTVTQAEEAHPEAELDEQSQKALRETLAAVLAEQMGKLDRLWGSGAERYEARLRGAGLGTSEERPIPADLDQALAEFGAIRDCLTHRHGRIDEKALEQAPSLASRYSVGQFVRLSSNDYRVYSAAIRCYGQDVAMRPMRGWSDVELPNLDRWRGYYILGA